LARYAIINREFFKDKFVLELGSGTGIAGLSVLKFTSCKNCLMSDYLPEVVENARKNCRDNGMQKAVVMKMNWKDYMSFNNRYDIIIGAEIVSPGGPLQELYLTLNRFLV
jgi:predicted nicotinamide N-methyase